MTASVLTERNSQSSERDTGDGVTGSEGRGQSGWGGVQEVAGTLKACAQQLGGSLTAGCTEVSNPAFRAWPIPVPACLPR